MACCNNQKQIGLAIHNFHDTRDGVVPATVGFGHWPSYANQATFWPLLYPFFEQQALYEQFARAQFYGCYGLTLSTGWNVYFNDYWWWNGGNEAGGLNAELRSQHSSISLMICPSRGRSGRMADSGHRLGPVDAAQPYDDADDDLNPLSSGPVSDYAGVIYFDDSGDAAYWWQLGGDQFPAAPGLPNHHYQKGPFRSAVVERAAPLDFDSNTWSPRDTFAYWLDGTSNQLVLGEKHIPNGYVGKCTSQPDASAPPDAASGEIWNYLGHGDCSCLNTAETRTPSSFRLVRYVGSLAPGGDFAPGIVPPTTMKYADMILAVFGTAHPGICNFLVGDGSVRGIPATIDPILLGWLGCVDDGNAVSFP
jgi:hypothetical protein